MAALGGKAFLFGGTTGGFIADDNTIIEGSIADDTWAWDGRTWTKVGPQTSPPGRANHAMATLGSKVVLFGGDAAQSPDLNAPSYGDTWEWDGTTWTEAAPPTSPPARTNHAMATLGNKVVLFGGTQTALPVFVNPPDGLPVPVSEGDTWEWDGTTWTQLAPPTSPPARMNHAMATLGNKVVLFGGEGANGPTDDTWEWDGTTWTKRAPPTSPPARKSHAMVTRGDRVLLVGGDLDYGAPGDSWEWDGASWTRVAEGPPGQFSISDLAMASRNGEILAFGGYDFGVTGPSGPAPPDPGGVAGNGGPPGTAGAPGFGGTSGGGTGGDPTGAGGASGSLSLGGEREFRGQVSGTWEWDGKAWLERLVVPTPDPAGTMSMAMSGGKAVLFGASIGTWEWDGVRWTALAAASPDAPYHRTGQAIASLGDKIVLFGGSPGGPGGPGGGAGPASAGGPGSPGGSPAGLCEPVADTWEWDGASWTPRVPTASPPARAGHAMATLGQKVVLFGGTTDPLEACVGSTTAPQPDLGDTWEWDGANWTKRTPAVSPPPRWGHAMVTLGGKVVLFGGAGADGPLNDTWAWNGVTWTRLAEASPPPARRSHALATVNNSIVLFGGRAEGDTLLHDTWVFTRNTWTQLSPLTSPPERAGHVMAGVAGEIMLIGGSWDSDMWLLSAPLP